MKHYRFLAIAAIVIAAAACSPTTYQQIDYLQDLNYETTLDLKENRAS